MALQVLTKKAFRFPHLCRIFSNIAVGHRYIVTNAALPTTVTEVTKPKAYKTESKYVYLEDPNTFGTLSGKLQTLDDNLEDEGDIKEQQFLENVPLPSQKLTIKQYADLIKQYLKHKRLKEAIDVLEIRMLKQDRVKPENYIYNILIGACANVGYTKKAFKLFNDMKKRALKPTGDTYTCLFEACINSPWKTDGLARAKRLRELMMEKGIEPNLTNYNAMIKAFGRCGDLPTAFQIVDEMVAKKIKIRVHTLNHLLHACITDKSCGLRHALIVWRKMIKLREKPNIYSFNLILKCVKDCNLGTKEDIKELIQIIQEHTTKTFNTGHLQIESAEICKYELNSEQLVSGQPGINKEIVHINDALPPHNGEIHKNTDTKSDKLAKVDDNDKLIVQNTTNVTLQLVNKNMLTIMNERKVPNLLSKVIKIDQVVSLQEVDTLQEKFAIIGGQEDFLKEMETYSVKPDIKTFTQMLSLIEESTEAENKLLETMSQQNVKADIDFYNMLIKKRCLRFDYEAAFAVQGIIEKENKLRKKKYPLKKKLVLKENIMTYGVLAMACKVKEDAERLLKEMKEKQIKVNIEILGSLLRQGSAKNNFRYVLFVMNIVKEEKLKVNDVFVKHLEAFNDKCAKFVEVKNESGQHVSSIGFQKGYKKFLDVYSKWIQEVNIEKAFTSEHPWQQFKENYPETVQRQNIRIVEPKRFYKKNRKYVPYVPRL